MYQTGLWIAGFGISIYKQCDAWVLQVTWLRTRHSTETRVYRF